MMVGLHQRSGGMRADLSFNVQGGKDCERAEVGQTGESRCNVHRQVVDCIYSDCAATAFWRLEGAEDLCREVWPWTDA